MSGKTSLPGFNESLRLLVQRERYSFLDIGLMFGVSLERVRQWCERRGIEHPDMVRGLNVVRVWNGVRDCFEPRAISVVKRERSDALRNAKRVAHHSHVRARQREIVLLVDRLVQELRREPSWREIWVALGNPDRVPKGAYAAMVIGYWDSSRGSTRKKIANFRAATRTAKRRAGRPRMDRAS